MATVGRCALCDREMVFQSHDKVIHDDVWVCDTCHRCVCYRCKTSILPPIDAEIPRVTIQCDACRAAEAVNTANVVTFREDDGTLSEAQVLETEVNLNWLWLRVDDGTPEGRWIRSDVVESFTATYQMQGE